MNTATHRIPLASPVTGELRYFGDVATWCDALDFLAGDEDPWKLWDANQTTHTTLTNAAKNPETIGKLKAIADHIAALVRDGARASNPGM